MDQATFRLDANESAFIERQLEYVRARSYDVKYDNLKARQLMPVDHEVPSGAETVKYNTYNMYGAAKLIASYADDLPRGDVAVVESRQAIKGIGASYGYSIQEIRAAQMAGLPLEQRKANAARRMIEQKIDDIAATGDSNNGLTGLLNVANALSYTVPNGAASSQLWSSKTGLEILKDMVGIVNKIVTDTKDVEHPDSLITPPAQFNIIASTPLQSGSDTTILTHFLRANPWVKTVQSWVKATGAGSGSTDRMVCYRNDPDALQLVIPQEFEQFPPQQKGLEFVVPCHARCGGVVAYYPLSVCYGDGI